MSRPISGEPATGSRRPGIAVSRSARVLLRRALCLFLLALFFALGLRQVIRASITFDEGPHLAIGYATLRTGDLRLQPIHIHPPLANVLAAAPLLLQDDLPDPTTIDGWEIASLSAVTDAVVWSYPEPQRIATAARVPILLLGVLAGALVCRWARDLGGAGAGLLALCLYTFDPNVIAHAALITTDTAAMLLSLATLYALSRFLGIPSRSVTRPASRRWALVATGVLLGLAQLAKVSALMLVPVTGLLLLLDAWSEGRGLWPAIGKAVARATLAVGIAALVVWAGYGFEIGTIEGWPIPVPAATHVKIYQSLNAHYELGHPTFALGKVNTKGWAWYFPLAFAVKTPLPVLLLALAALAAAICAPRTTETATTNPSAVRSNRFSSSAAVALFPLLYVVAGFFSTVNIGYRHLLPLLPFLFIGIGIACARTRKHRVLASAVLAVLLAWLAIGTLRTLPYPLTFFNELVGGPAGGYEVLVDSNLDWGQNLWDLKDWMADHGESRVAYAHYSPARLSVYGIDADTLPPDPGALSFAPWNPAPGLYAIGATVLQGPYAPDINTYAWFRDREPEVRLGNALLVYRVEAQESPSWVLLCAPVTDAGGARRRVGVEDLRVVQPLCDQALVYPQGTGLTILPPGSTFPEAGETLFSLRDAEGEATAEVRTMSGEVVVPQIAAPTGMRMESPLTFLGHTVSATSAQVWTYWRIDAIPARPLSLMAHLIATDGTGIAVGDGMGFPLDQWRVGDMIVQQHAFESFDGATSLEVGGYWLDTLERWGTDDGEDSLTIPLSPGGGD